MADLDSGGLELRADCARCVGLCCVALPFAASADFAFDKEAGVPCLHLESDFSCGIHARLREEGFRGCSAFDCFGAGQQVTQTTFEGQDWRDAADVGRAMFAVFPVMRRLHELLWYLTEAVALPEAAPVVDDLRGALREVESATHAAADVLETTDVATYRRQVGPLLDRVSELVRAEVHGAESHRGADLAGARLGGADLRGADLRGALLIAADLRAADLRQADLLGADLRDADLSGADLDGALFLTRSQVGAARGDASTRLPRRLDIPAHWR